jgi:hypothetical protein
MGPPRATADRLTAGGVPVPAVLQALASGTVVSMSDAVCEVHRAATGTDLYRVGLYRVGLYRVGLYRVGLYRDAMS